MNVIGIAIIKVYREVGNVRIYFASNRSPRPEIT